MGCRAGEEGELLLHRRSTYDKRAVADPGREIVFSDAPEKVGVNNLLEIYELLTGEQREAIEAHFAGKGYGQLKQELTDFTRGE